MDAHLVEIKAVYRHYRALCNGLDAEHGLGGRLLYAGALDEESMRCVRASNIAGAASLTTSHETNALRKAMREGVVDFVVTTLDEALRIMKNEIRKRQPVSVGIQGECAGVETEMRERGVEADLTIPGSLSDGDGLEFLALAMPPGNAALTAALEAVVMMTLPAEDLLNRRWFHLAPRYLGRDVRNVRSLMCDAGAAKVLRAWYREHVRS